MSMELSNFNYCICKILYEIEKQEPENPISSDDLKLLVDIEYNELLMDIKYLKREGYVEFKEFFGADFEANITLKGIEKIITMI
ncbi:hypothetical protein [Methanobacterium sp. SMA-27]|uniref:hypothetical protein n=1 Tax=Methanobacterium sp. SMA-27 TaxID=1495336 RepID=UPI0012E012AF|nr:hypothetical protein [Methanobacterium sp. SMA-27]